MLDISHNLSIEESEQDRAIPCKPVCFVQRDALEIRSHGAKVTGATVY